MLRKAFGFSFLVAVLVCVLSVSSWAIVKGLEEEKQSLVKVGESVVVPPGAGVKSAVAVGGSVTVYGQVDEDVVAIGGPVILRSSAVVGGDIVAVGGQVVKESGAVAKGEIIEVAIAGISPTVNYFAKGGMLRGMLIFGLLSFLGFLMLAAILVALFTPQLGRVSGNIENNLWRNFLLGLLIVVLFVPIILILVVSVVGIALIPVWVILVAAACLFGYIAAAHFLGKKTLQAIRLTGKSMMVETLTGVILLAFVGVVPIAGFLVKMIAGLWGLGAVYQTRFGTR